MNKTHSNLPNRTQVKSAKTRKTHRPRTQRVTSRPLSRQFSGFWSFFLHFRNSKFSEWHLIPMCFDDAINTAEVGIGFPEASTALAMGSSNLFKAEKGKGKLISLVPFGSRENERKLHGKGENFKFWGSRVWNAMRRLRMEKSFTLNCSDLWSLEGRKREEGN